MAPLEATPGDEEATLWMPMASAWGAEAHGSQRLHHDNMGAQIPLAAKPSAMRPHCGCHGGRSRATP